MKKAVALGLIATLTAATLAACNETKETTKDDTDKSQVETTVDNDKGGDETTEGAEDEGTTAGENEEPPAGDPVKFSIMSSIWGDHEKSLREDGKTDIFDKMMELSNTEIEFMWFPADQYAQRVTTTLSTGEIPEVINNAMGLLVTEGAAVALDDVLESHGQNILAALEGQEIEAAKLRSTIDGNTYAVPFTLLYPQAYAWNIRTDWLENVGLEKPETWDEWLEVWEAFATQDPNKDGNKENDVALAADLYSMMPAFGMNVANKNGLYVDENGKYTIAEESENYDTYLESMRDLYERGLLDQEFTQRGVWVDNVKLSEAINAGVIGSSFTWAEITRTATEGLGEVTEGAKLEGITAPTGPNGHSGIPSRAMITPTSTITISAEENGNLEGIVSYFNWLYSEEGTKLMSYGIEGVHHEIVDGKPALKEGFLTFADARAAGINFTPLAHHFDKAAYESIMLGGQTYEEAPEATKIFYDALYMGEGKWFNYTPILNSETFEELGTDLFSQLGTARAEVIAGVISVDEFWSTYENLKESGLSKILEEQDAIWQSMNG